jgi:hypothetical protein
MDKTSLAALSAFPDLLSAHFALFPEIHRHWTPACWDGIPSEKLSAIEQLCHLGDIEIEAYQRRIARTLAEENPFLPSIDTDALANSRRYSEDDPDTVLTTFRQARKETIELISNLHAEQLKRKAEFEGYGAVTLRGLIHFLCSHDQQHLAGMQWLLGKIDSTYA